MTVAPPAMDRRRRSLQQRRGKTPMRDRTGKIIGELAGLPARHDAEAELRRLAAIVASSDDAIIGTTLDGVVTSWNRGG